MYLRHAQASAWMILMLGNVWGGERPPFKSDKPPIPGIEVELRLSIKQLDPLKPDKGDLRCIVRNRSNRSILAPTVYTGGFLGSDMMLWANDEWTLTMYAWGGEKKQVMKQLKPGEEVVVYRAELKELLLLEVDRDRPLKAGEKRIYWGWTA